MKTKWLQRPLAVLLLLSLLLVSGCGKQNPTETTGPATEPLATEDAAAIARMEEEQKAFDVFTEEAFKEEVTVDTLTLHYMVADPESMGLTRPPISFGDFSLEGMKTQQAELEETKRELDAFSRELLTPDQQLTYDILEHTLTLNLSAEGLDFYYEPLTIGVGFQAQLPILLAEYTFYTEQDVKDYLSLLQELAPFFEEIMIFERAKADKGLFMTDAVLDEIVQGCLDFIKTPEENTLLATFEERLAALDGLSEESKADYLVQNRDGVLNFVIPAYQNLINGLHELRGSGTNAMGLCHYPDGKKYYEYLVASATGSSKTVDELKKATEEHFQRDLMSMSLLMQNSKKDLAAEAANFKFSLTDPQTILTDLKGKIVEDFPEIPEIPYNIKYVHESLQDSLSPAFYLVPPVDRYMADNVIYINPASTNAESSLYTTLAHEGYPGHLYQTIYEKSLGHALIRDVLSFNGYTEGWATYVENYAYTLDSNVDQVLAGVVQRNQSASLAVYALMDFHIHYDGWDIAQTTDFLSQVFGVSDSEVIEEIYYYIVSNPTNYLSYYIGYMEFTELRDEAKEALQDDFVLKDFHKFILDTGSAPFGIIEERMQDWIAAQKN